METLFDFILVVVGAFLMTFGGASFEIAGEKPEDPWWYRGFGLGCIMVGAVLWVMV